MVYSTRSLGTLEVIAARDCRLKVAVTLGYFALYCTMKISTMAFMFTSSPKLPSLLLRIGLATVFLYAAVGSLQHPIEWIGYLPMFLQKMSDVHLLINLFAVYEIFLTVWLLSGRFIRYAGAVCALTLAGIVVSQPGALIITFRDVGLVFMALALAVDDDKSSYR